MSTTGDNVTSSRAGVAARETHDPRESWLATADSGASAKEREDRRLAIKRIVWIGGVIAWPLFAITDYLDASASPRPHILGTLLFLRFAGWVVSAVLLAVLRRPNISSRVITACDVLGFASYSLNTAIGAVVMGGLGVNVVLGIMIIAFLRAALIPSHWSRAFITATFTFLLLPATGLAGALLDPRVRAEWLAPEKIHLLVYSTSMVLAGVVVGATGCHMAWRARRKVFAARQLGKYRLKARIGSGAMGDVWLARQDLLGRDVAVKVLRHHDSDPTGELRRRFAREAKAASLLRHPNTIRVIEYGASDDGSYFIAMELLDGVDLATLVERNGPLPAWRAIHLALQACGSLGEAHDLGIVHRDIKPANLFVTRVGEADDFLKLLDFGIARMIDGDASTKMTEVGKVFGTPAYMAPEACRGERADARTDVYSLGAVMYFMLTGGEVFQGKSAPDTILAHLKQTPDAMAKRLHGPGAQVPADLEAVVMRCLAKDRAARFQTTRELEQALRACADCRARRAESGATLPPPTASSTRPVAEDRREETHETMHVSSLPPSSQAAFASPDAAGKNDELPARPARTQTAGESEERRRALLRVAWIACIVAWPFFVVTDLVDALASHRARTLPALLALRVGLFAISALQIVGLRKASISKRMLALCDVACFAGFGLLVSLQPVLVPGLEAHALFGIMIVAFMRASLVPSHWSRAFGIAALAACVLPLTLTLAGAISPALGAHWLESWGDLAYSLGQVIAASALGSVASHMTWQAQREILEARKLGQYRLKARLGSGSTGDVWLARQDALDRDVALKVLRQRGDEDEESLRRFAREAKAASSLHHPNTIRIIEYGASDDGVYFIAMELLDGIELEKLVARDGPLPPWCVIHMALQACGSLREAHERGIVHRDIKPANLFVTRVGEDPYFLKLLDFGIAKLVEGDQSSTMTQAGGMFGTPAYMSPEACCGEAIDARSDIYSFGAVMYCMLTGTELFPGQGFAETLMSHVQVAPERIADRLKDGRAVPEDLERVVMRCLAKRAEDRYASARELEDALRACADCSKGAARAA